VIRRHALTIVGWATSPGIIRAVKDYRIKDLDNEIWGVAISL